MPMQDTAPKPDLLVRWRGKTSGPFTLVELEQKLARNEIGMLHEVLHEGRWIQLRQLIPPSTPRTVSETEPVPASSPAPERRTMSIPTAGDSRVYPVRWRGAEVGQLTLEQIEYKLDRQEIGMLHEIESGGAWISLGEFFIQRNAQLSAARELAPAARPSPAPSDKQGARIALMGIMQQVAGGTKILEEVNLVVEPNEFVAVLGPSGSGKSTLMNVMTGRKPPTGGTVAFNGENFYAKLSELRQSIGYVPQKDIVHLALTVTQELTFAARLRLPQSFSTPMIQGRVSEVISQIGLEQRTRTRIGSLSGGQLKRVSLGVELLADPALLFLDEATSGLDAGTEARMMSLFRGLADRGRTVVCITHNLENVCLCDLVAILTGGRLAYYGPTKDLLRYFGLSKLSEVYDCLDARPPAEWAQRYASSEFCRKYVTERLAASTPDANAAASSAAGVPNMTAKSRGALLQLPILIHRYLTVTLQDRRNVILLLAQAPVIGLLLGVVFSGESLTGAKAFKSHGTLSFLMMISAIWFGCINAAREVVKESQIYLRERAVGLSLASYLASKITVLSLLCLVQCLTLIAVTLIITGYRPEVPALVACIFVTSLAGMLMGLLVSSLVKNEDKAMAIVPVLLIPQVIFAGVITELSGLSETVAKWGAVSYWAYDAVLHSVPDAVPDYEFAEDMITMGIFVLVFVVVAGIALKRKDSH